MLISKGIAHCLPVGMPLSSARRNISSATEPGATTGSQRIAERTMEPAFIGFEGYSCLHVLSMRVTSL